MSNFGNWVEKNKFLTFIIFWGVFFMFIYFFDSLRDNSADFSVPQDEIFLDQYCGPGGSPC